MTPLPLLQAFGYRVCAASLSRRLRPRPSESGARYVLPLPLRSTAFRLCSRDVPGRQRGGLVYPHHYPPAAPSVQIGIWTLPTGGAGPLERPPHIPTVRAIARQVERHLSTCASAYRSLWVCAETLGRRIASVEPLKLVFQPRALLPCVRRSVRLSTAPHFLLMAPRPELTSKTLVAIHMLARGSRSASLPFLPRASPRAVAPPALPILRCRVSQRRLSPLLLHAAPCPETQDLAPPVVSPQREKLGSYRSVSCDRPYRA